MAQYMISIRETSITILLVLASSTVYAADSYRFFHVTIDTPWLIFIFLLMIILFPFVLSAILYWHFMLRKRRERLQQAAESGAVVENKSASINENAAPEEK